MFSSLEMVSEIEFVNIREQCAWVHQDNRDVATASAKSLIKTALARLYERMKKSDLEKEHWQAAMAIVESTAEGLEEGLRNIFLNAAPVREIMEHAAR